MSKEIELEKKEDGIFILYMKSGENRFNPKFLAEFHNALDTVEKSEGSCALITIGEGKFYSNGLDLNWIAANRSEANKLIPDVIKLFARLLVFPVPTIAVINGHAFAAGGFMIALAHDFRVMRDDRGFLCLPEIDIKLPFATGMSKLITTKITDPQTQRDAMILGKRFSAKEALSLRIIDSVCSEKELLPAAIELAKLVASKGEDRAILSAIKKEMYMSAYIPMSNGELGLAGQLSRL